VVLKDTLVMGADYYEEETAVLRERGGIPLGVGHGTTRQRAPILDKNVRIETLAIRSRIATRTASGGS